MEYKLMMTLMPVLINGERIRYAAETCDRFATAEEAKELGEKLLSIGSIIAYRVCYRPPHSDTWHMHNYVSYVSDDEGSKPSQYLRYQEMGK